LFEYKATMPDGEVRVLTFKPVTQVPIGILRRNSKDNEAQMWETLAWGLTAEDLEVLDQLPSNELENIMRLWQAADDTTLGESSASPASSTSTAGRSKPTSSS
jgi:hypothetical protein